jgi:RNA polymerase sigma-70 factor (ECF subfamily)
MTSDPRPALDDDARRAAAGDREAFERVYRATCARLHALAVRLVGRGEAEEATQEAYVRAWHKLASWRGEAAFATWLHRVCVNVCLSRRAGLARDLARVADDERAAAHEAPAAARIDLEHLRLDLEQAIERLPDGARAVFVLRDVEGLTHAEIAERLGVTTGTSKSQLHRARLLLRGMLGDEEDHG